MSADVKSPATTCAVRILVRVALFSGFNRVYTVPAGSASNAEFTGAKTVNGPGPISASTRPAALTAATNVVWSLEFTAFSMMFLVSNIGAPPTSGFAKAGAASMANTRAKVVDFIVVLPMVGRRVCVPSDERTEANRGKFQDGYRNHAFVKSVSIACQFWARLDQSAKFMLNS